MANSRKKEAAASRTVVAPMKIDVGRALDPYP